MCAARPAAGPLRLRIVTDTTGFVLDMEPAAAVFLNVSIRYARGRSLLPYVENGRLDVARDLHAVPSAGLPPRKVTLRPRERRAVEARLTLKQHNGGIEWIVDVIVTNS